MIKKPKTEDQIVRTDLRGTQLLDVTKLTLSILAPPVVSLTFSCRTSQAVTCKPKSALEKKPNPQPISRAVCKFCDLRRGTRILSAHSFLFSLIRRDCSVSNAEVLIS